MFAGPALTGAWSDEMLCEMLGCRGLHRMHLVNVHMHLYQISVMLCFLLTVCSSLLLLQHITGRSQASESVRWPGLQASCKCGAWQPILAVHEHLNSTGIGQQHLTSSLCCGPPAAAALVAMLRPSVPANTPVVFDVQLLYIPGEGSGDSCMICAVGACHAASSLFCGAAFLAVAHSCQCCQARS
jgi:hypothetical protein